MSRQYKYKIIRKKFWLIRPYRIEVIIDDGEGFENLFLWGEGHAFTVDRAKKQAENVIRYDKQLQNPEPEKVVYESEVIS